jgi:gluconate kinase
MPASLLKSQFDTLEPPQRALDVDVSRDVETNVNVIVEQVRARG